MNNEKSDSDKFIDSLGNIDEISSTYLMIRLSSLSDEEVNMVLEKPSIRSKLAIGLLKESRGDFYAGFRKILNYFTVEQFLSLYDVGTLKSFFVDGLKEHEYKLFATLLDRDITETIKYVLNDDEMFDELFKLNYNFYSFFADISYDLFRDIILKMGNNISSYPDAFIGVASTECQRNILKENISDEMLVYLIPKFNVDVISEFFCNDSRAIYLYNKFNIKNFVSCGVKFSDEIVKKKDFFDGLKSESFVNFRTIINEAEKNNNLDIIERRLNSYYDEIINSYDPETGLFREYLEIINNSDFKLSQRDISFIMDNKVIMGIYNYREYDSNGEIKDDRLKFYLKRVTSKKLSEVIVDALFEDNIYNVWLNIKEMLRYNSKLSNDQKVIDEERENLYNLILHFDDISSDEKISLFHKLRDKRVGFVFYDDIRRLKDLSYDLIKKEMFNVDDKKNDIYLNDHLSQEYNVKVYDLRDKEYTMLIRGQYKYRQESGNRRNCYSIIGSDNSAHYGDYNSDLVYYGYNSFANDRVIHVLEQDSFSGDTKDGTSSRYVNRIMTADELIRNNSWYSEIDLVNVKNANYKYDAKKPDFIVYYDNNICDINLCIEESSRLNIPIVIIKQKELDMDNRLDIPFNQAEDYYIDYSDKRIEDTREGKGRK